jgi:hypothetical protein
MSADAFSGEWTRKARIGTLDRLFGVIRQIRDKVLGSGNGTTESRALTLVSPWDIYGFNKRTINLETGFAQDDNPTSTEWVMLSGANAGIQKTDYQAQEVLWCADGAASQRTV